MRSICESKPLVSIVFVTYNNVADLCECLQSLKEQTYRNFEIVITDNGSDTEMIKYLNSLDNGIKRIITGNNNGFGRGNNIALKECSGELIVFCNYDTVFDPLWLETLVATAQSSTEIGVVVPKITHYNERLKINTCGLYFSYLGYACTEDFQKSKGSDEGVKEIATASGCCFMIKREILTETGAFDEEYHNFGSSFFFSSLEDVDLCWRVRLIGKKVILNPAAQMYHKYNQKKLSLLRYLYLECGRCYILLKNYRMFTLIILSPALLLFELFTWIFALLQGPGFFRMKLKSYKILKDKNHILQIKRTEIKQIRKINDYEIIAKLGSFIKLRHVKLFMPVAKSIEVVLDMFFSAYKVLISKILICFKK